jgi:hypothetical protein
MLGRLKIGLLMVALSLVMSGCALMKDATVGFVEGFSAAAGEAAAGQMLE